jgi:hypothetical protein
VPLSIKLRLSLSHTPVTALLDRTRAVLDRECAP